MSTGKAIIAHHNHKSLTERFVDFGVSELSSSFVSGSL
ncbi:hypothetical protein SX4_0641 [Vibrio mimicus SX-4]|nr:hypothetical protein SX4_0641 [Vibrio mimicus SX-4]